MPKTNIKSTQFDETNAAIALVQWPVQSVLAFQTTRNYPNHRKINHSKLPYDEFNLGLHVGDNAIDVNANRDFVERNLLGGKKIQWLEQVHGNDVAIVTAVSEQPLVADASITSSEHIALAIMTADCLPILLSDKAGTTIAAIHGGWRSLANGIIANTLAKMAIDPAQLYAWLGPCIGENAFEVGGDVYENFINQSNSFANAFELQQSGKYLASLHQIARIQLAASGIQHINALDECTYDNHDKYYSYRRSAITGRMATIISRR